MPRLQYYYTITTEPSKRGLPRHNYSIGLGIPFIISAIAFEKVKGAFKQIQRHSKIISIVSGVLLIAAGVMVFTGSLKYLVNI